MTGTMDMKSIDVGMPKQVNLIDSELQFAAANATDRHLFTNRSRSIHVKAARSVMTQYEKISQGKYDKMSYRDDNRTDHKDAYRQMVTKALYNADHDNQKKILMTKKRNILKGVETESKFQLPSIGSTLSRLRLRRESMGLPINA